MSSLTAAITDSVEANYYSESILTAFSRAEIALYSTNPAATILHLSALVQLWGGRWVGLSKNLITWE